MKCLSYKWLRRIVQHFHNTPYTKCILYHCVVLRALDFPLGVGPRRKSRTRRHMLVEKILCGYFVSSKTNDNVLNTFCLRRALRK